jgi:hypothetical protein
MLLRDSVGNLYRVLRMRVIGAVLAVCLLVSLVAGTVAGAWGRTPAGNTALIVPFSVGPATLAAGWAWLALDGDTADRRQVLISVVAITIATLVLAALTALLPIVALGSGIPPLAGLIALAVPIVLAAPIGAALAARHNRPRPGRGWGAMPLVIMLLFLLVVAPSGTAPVLAPLLVPCVVVAPLAPDLGRTGALVQRLVGIVLLPILVSAGHLLGMSLTP